MTDTEIAWHETLSLLRRGRELVAENPSQDILRAVGVLPWRLEHQWSREAGHLLCRALGKASAPYDHIWVTHYSATTNQSDRLALIDRAIDIGEADKAAGRAPVAWRVRANRWEIS